MQNEMVFAKLLERNLECPILKSWGYSFVTTMCGHTFDKLALLQHFKSQAAIPCPLCKTFIFHRDIMFLAPNTYLNDLLDESLPSLCSSEELAEYKELKKDALSKLKHMESDYIQISKDHAQSTQFCVAYIENIIRVMREKKYKQIRIDDTSQKQVFERAQLFVSYMKRSRYTTDTVGKICFENDIFFQYRTDTSGVRIHFCITEHSKVLNLSPSRQ